LSPFALTQGLEENKLGTGTHGFDESLKSLSHFTGNVKLFINFRKISPVNLNGQGGKPGVQLTARAENSHA